MSNTPRTDAAFAFDPGMKPAEAMRQLERELAAVTKERDDYHKKACEIADQRDKSQAQLAAAKEDADRLAGALEPFAKIINWADIHETDGDADAFLTGSRNMIQDVCGVREAVVTVGDLRRATDTFAAHRKSQP